MSQPIREISKKSRAQSFYSYCRQVSQTELRKVMGISNQEGGNRSGLCGVWHCGKRAQNSCQGMSSNGGEVARLGLGQFGWCRTLKVISVISRVLGKSSI